MADRELPADVRMIVEQSHEAKQHAYCPQSNFRVGAALLSKDGKVFNGCNVENVAHALAVCAVPCAFYNAVSEGCREFKAIAIASDMQQKFISPCGACRHVMYELGGKDLEVYLTKPDLSWKRVTNEELMPFPFDDFQAGSK